MEEYDAVLDAWNTQSHPNVADFVIWGHIKGDNKRRFRDGCYMHTSGIPYEKLEGLKEGMIIQTRNSKYKLGKPFKGS